MKIIVLSVSVVLTLFISGCALKKDCDIKKDNQKNEKLYIGE